MGKDSDCKDQIDFFIKKGYKLYHDNDIEGLLDLYREYEDSYAVGSTWKYA